MKFENRIEQALLEHIRRYRLGVVRCCWLALHGRYPTLTKQQTKQALNELQQLGFLHKESMPGHRSCYRLSERSWQRFGAPTHDPPRGSSERATLMDYAMLMLCHRDAEQRRRKLLRDELAEYLPEKDFTGWNCDRYYLHEQQLGLLRVDLGGRGRWDRVLGYAARDLARHETEPAFQVLLGSGHFELAIVTCSQQKAKRIRQQLARRPLHRVVQVEALACDDLLNLLSPPPIKLTRIPH